MSGLILTTAGAAAIEAAYQAGTVVKITLAAFGDGGGKPITPNPDATALVNKFGDAQFTGGASTEGMISGQTVIEARKYPGKVLREVGLVSADGVLVAYGDYPETVLPADGAPVMKEIIINFVMTLTHAESVVIEVDPNVSALTISEADKRYLRQSLNLSDVSNTTEARSHLQVYSKVEADGRYVTQQNGTATGLKITDQFTLNDQVRAYRDDQALFFEVKRDDGTQPAYFSMSADGGRLRCRQLLADEEIRVGLTGARIYRDGSDLYFQVGAYFFGLKANGEIAGNRVTAETSVNVGSARMQGDGNIWGTRWNPNGAWLWDEIVNQLNTRATVDYVNSLRDTAGAGWFRSGSSGRIIQAFNVSDTGGQTVRRANFPIPFPSGVDAVNASWTQTGSQMDYPVRIVSWDSSGVSYVADGNANVSFFASGS